MKIRENQGLPFLSNNVTLVRVLGDGRFYQFSTEQWWVMGGGRLPPIIDLIIFLLSKRTFSL